MSIEKITSKILEDANLEAQDIINKANKKKEILLNAARESAEHSAIMAKEKGKKEKEKIISQKKSVADIDSRKMMLETKQSMIESCFKRAEKKVLELSDEKYLDFLINIIRDSKLKEGEITLCKRDMDRYENVLTKTLEERLDGKFYLSKEIGKFKGGLILRKDKIYINGTIEGMLDDARENLSLQVSKILFQ